MFAKGHGTQNDFVLLPDLDGRLTLDPAAVAALCDRRRGIGADGVLRVTKAGAAADAGVFDRLPEGVGRRRLVHGLPQRRRLDRADVRQRRSSVRPLPAGEWAGDAATSSSSARWRARGRWCSTPLTTPPPTSPSRWARPTSLAPARRPWADAGSPASRSTSAIRTWRASTPTLTVAELAALDVAAPVQFDTEQFPEGVNVEVITAPVGGSVTMRVHERGVGETRSCGTGTVAAAVAALAHRGCGDRHACRSASPAVEVTVTSPTPAATCAALRYWWPAARYPRNGGVRSSVNSDARSTFERAPFLITYDVSRFSDQRHPELG